MNRRLFVVFLVISALSLGIVPQAAAHGLGWIDEFGSRGNDNAWSVAVTSSAIYVAGDTDGRLPGKTSHGSSDGFMVKYDPSGTKIWARQFGTSGFDTATAVAADATGVYVAGYTERAFPGKTHKGDFDGFVRKLTPSGDTVWTVQFGTKRSDGVSGIALGPDGLSVVGSTWGTFADQHRHGNGDAFIMQFTTSGSRQWVRQFGSTESDYGFGVAADPAGVVVTGLTLGSLPGQTSYGGFDAFVVAVAPDGTRRWTHQLGTAGNNDAFGASIFGGVVYVSGSTEKALPGQTDHGSVDAFVRAYTTDGSGLWTRQFGTDKADAAVAVAADATGIYVTGTTYGRFGHQPDRYRSDVFVRAFDASGGGMWTSQFGSPGFDTGWSVSTDDTGIVYVAGDFLGGSSPAEAFVAQLS
jgi:hypothetical protein